ncbi:MAG: hypothetical protein ACLPYB_13360 [Desulfobaccales bacterium]
MRRAAAVRPGAAGDAGLGGRFWGIWLALAVCLAVSACGELRPVPRNFEAQAYRAIGYQDLLHPDQAGLKAGDLVQVRAYFWQYLTYDPAMLRNYLTLPRYPVDWYRLRWFAVYASEKMEGYYDLAALSPEQEKQYKIKRLDHILIYGELSPLKPGLFLRVHHIEKIAED